MKNNPPSKIFEESDSESTPYMVLPDSKPNEQNLTIEDNDNVLISARPNTTQSYLSSDKLNEPDVNKIENNLEIKENQSAKMENDKSQSLCCLLL